MSVSEKVFDDDDSERLFAAFVKEYELLISGKVIAVSEDSQYAINNDPLKLIFQYDDCFGIVVIAPYETDIKTAEQTLNTLFDRLQKS